MDFKKMPLIPILLGVLLLSLVLWKVFFGNAVVAPDEKISPSASVNNDPSDVKEEALTEDDAAIQQQLDQDREHQKQTKELRVKLEQINLELEQEKALAEIDKLKKDNAGAFSDPMPEGQNNLPEIKIDYIGGSDSSHEAIISIGGASYQVKVNSSPTDNIQVTAISDSSVTLHFSGPVALTKTFDFKPE